MTTRLKKGLLFISAYLARCLYIVYFKTIRIQVVNERYTTEHMLSPKNPIYVSWHSKTFLIMPLFRNRRICILTLLDWKNRFYDCLCRCLGFETIQITNQQKATLQLVKSLKQGSPIALAVDGPHGPRGVMKEGFIYLAKKTGRPVVVTRVEVEKSFRLKWRWDQYEIPYPFTKAKIFLEEPVFMSDSSNGEETKLKKMFGAY